MHLCYLGKEVIKMAEFCVDCFNKMMGITDSARKYHISKELDLCEECGEYKRVIVCIKRRYLIAECIRDIWDYRVKKKS